MLNAGQILKTISQQSHKDTQNDSAMAAFVNWLSHNCDSHELITAELLNRFFQNCLEYPHWQKNKQTLGDELRYFLEAICLHQNETFDSSEVVWPVEMQIIELERLPDWVDAINSYLTFQYLSREKFRLLHDEALGQLLAIVLKSNGEVSVRQFSRKFFIRNGALTPLREDYEVHYNSNFDLREEVSHKIETTPFTTARFQNLQGELFGSIARGYFFQKHVELNATPLSSAPRLFYTLKRLEQHFIKRESDPFYQNLIETTEHGIKMLRIGDEHALDKAPDWLSQAQNALEYVFIGDKLLSLLVRDLQYTMAGRVSHKATTTAGKQEFQQKDAKAWSPLKTSSPSSTTISKTPTKNPQPQLHPVSSRRSLGPKSDLTN
jgi:hypothetical protein